MATRSRPPKLPGDWAEIRDTFSLWAQQKWGEYTWPKRAAQVTAFLGWAAAQGDAADMFIDPAARDRAVGGYQKMLFRQGQRIPTVDDNLRVLDRLFAMFGTGRSTVALDPQLFQATAQAVRVVSGEGRDGGPVDWATPGQDRHVVVLTLACIRLADRIVRVAWHDGFPHSTGCPQGTKCVYWEFQRAYYNNLASAWPLLLWRRHALFGGSLVGTYASGIASLLAQGVPLWDAEEFADQDTLRQRLETTLWELRAAARRLGLDGAPAAVGEARQYLTGLCDVLQDRPTQP